MFDSIQVKIDRIAFYKSPFTNTRIVPFVNSYFDILKAVVNDVQTEYFWFFASFTKLDSFNFEYIPEQHEKDQIHVWYTTHPMGGLNKEGNVMLIPTAKFKEQMHNIKFLRDFKDINYHADPLLEQQPITRTVFKLADPYSAYHSVPRFYQWLVNDNIVEQSTLQKNIKVPNFYPSLWEDEKVYTFGKTKDIMLVPYRKDLKQFYDIDRTVHYDYEYDVKPMDIVFMSYDEPNAELRYKKLKEKYPRAKWSKGSGMRTLDYMAAANMSETDYFFCVFPRIDIVDTFKFDFQPDRLKNPCHYIFDCYNSVIDCTYGHGGIIMYNKQLVMQTARPGIDFTLSKAHTSVPILSAEQHYKDTPLHSYRSAFREVVKLKLQMDNKPTVETKYRLGKWCMLGKGVNAESVYNGAMDALDFVNEGKDPMLSYELGWVNKQYKEKYEDSV